MMWSRLPLKSRSAVWKSVKRELAERRYPAPAVIDARKRYAVGRIPARDRERAAAQRLANLEEAAARDQRIAIHVGRAVVADLVHAVDLGAPVRPAQAKAVAPEAVGDIAEVLRVVEGRAFERAAAVVTIGGEAEIAQIAFERRQRIGAVGLQSRLCVGAFEHRERGAELARGVAEFELRTHLRWRRT